MNTPRSRAAVAAAAVLAVVAGVVVGWTAMRLGGSATTSSPSSSVTPSSSETNPSSGTGTSPTTMSPTTMSPSATTPATGAPGTGAPATTVKAPTGYVPEPWDHPGGDFGFITAASLNGDGSVRITFDRAQWLTGQAYDDWVAVHGPPDNDYVIVNENTKLRTFTLPAGASLSGSIQLVPGDSGQTDLTAEAFVDAVQAVASGGGHVPSWLFHSTTDLESSVTAAQEQYLP